MPTRKRAYSPKRCRILRLDEAHGASRAIAVRKANIAQGYRMPIIPCTYPVMLAAVTSVANTARASLPVTQAQSETYPVSVDPAGVAEVSPEASTTVLPGTMPNTSESVVADSSAAYTEADDAVTAADSVMDTDSDRMTAGEGSTTAAACSAGVSVTDGDIGAYLIIAPPVPITAKFVLAPASAVSCGAEPVPLVSNTDGGSAGGQQHLRGMGQQHIS